jgi:hypothetical protein
MPFDSLAADEKQLIGRWELSDQKVRGDQAEKRIQWLLSNDLKLLARDWSGWEALYCDGKDGRLWELTYPQGYLQGGGPRSLKNISEEDARLNYGQYDETH